MLNLPTGLCCPATVGGFNFNWFYVVQSTNNSEYDLTPNKQIKHNTEFHITDTLISTELIDLVPEDFCGMPFFNLYKL